MAVANEGCQAIWLMGKPAALRQWLGELPRNLTLQEWIRRAGPRQSSSGISSRMDQR
jgi:hypothetical protein